MTKALEKIEQKIRHTRERLLRDEELARKQRKRYAEKELTALGKLAISVGLDRMDRTALLGAFLSIAEDMEDPSKVGEWAETAKAFEQREIRSKGVPLSISFSRSPPEQVAAALRQAGFRWNAFRREWQGHGQIEKLKELLSDVDARIEAVR